MLASLLLHFMANQLNTDYLRFSTLSTFSNIKYFCNMYDIFFALYFFLMRFSF